MRREYARNLWAWTAMGYFTNMVIHDKARLHKRSFKVKLRQYTDIRNLSPELLYCISGTDLLVFDTEVFF